MEKVHRKKDRRKPEDLILRPNVHNLKSDCTSSSTLFTCECEIKSFENEVLAGPAVEISWKQSVNYDWF